MSDDYLRGVVDVLTALAALVLAIFLFDMLMDLSIRLRRVETAPLKNEVLSGVTNTPETQVGTETA